MRRHFIWEEYDCLTSEGRKYKQVFTKDTRLQSLIQRWFSLDSAADLAVDSLADAAVMDMLVESVMDPDR